MNWLGKFLFLGRLAFGEEILIVICFHVVIPLSLFLWLLFFRSKTKFNWCLKILLSGAYLLLFYLAGRWSIISVYWRNLTAILFLGAVGGSFFKVKDEPLWDVKTWPEWLAAVGAGVFWLVTVFLIVVVMRGRIPPGDAIELQFPLKSGAYYIFNGGDSMLINNYRANAFFNQKRIAAAVQYAVDIEKLNQFGMAARGVKPRDYKDYAIFGETVYSPCHGQVVEVIEDLPDLNPPDKDWLNITGNRVVIRSFGRILITLYHLQRDSVIVEPGDWVSPGQAIASVGNSGLSIRPHLTIQATEDFLWGRGVPIIFDGGFPVRNRIFIQR